MVEAIRFLQHHLSPFWLSVFRLSIWLVLLSLIFVPAERLWAERKQKLARKAVLTDLFYYFLNNLLPANILAVPVSYLAVATHRLLPAGVTAVVAQLPLWLRLIAVLVVGEIGFYWGHRWSHQSPFLWRFHAVHHSAEEIDWLVNTRAHPLDMVFTRFCGIVPLYVLGLAQPVAGVGNLALLPILLTGTVWGFFIHANVRWRFGWLEWLIATPAFHHWHHTRDDHRDHNYAATLPWLDRLFGTYYLPRGGCPERYGTDTQVSSGLAGQLLLTRFAPPFAARAPEPTP